jgi:hypothetical protein
MSLTRLNASSKQYTATKTFPAQDGRGYLFIYVVSGDLTVEFGGGGGAIPITAGGFLEPAVTPTSEITMTINPAATYIVLSDQQVA